ncbi:hypothetical protein FA95DRAFT_1612561 [Auriscalpium vulgare]|uniref:Uncharacterized protein n=1 Tax=Auriscalpium vulgare TaxID=40419 RepID=A0ACB8R684_9AGAM|nr:hypothetical protein FA95DRAFT_1612561 [Auriscalpium vulgare]
MLGAYSTRKIASTITIIPALHSITTPRSNASPSFNSPPLVPAQLRSLPDSSNRTVLSEMETAQSYELKTKKGAFGRHESTSS